MFLFDTCPGKITNDMCITKHLVNDITLCCLFSFKLYQKPRFYPDSHVVAYQKYRGRLNQQQVHRELIKKILKSPNGQNLKKQSEWCVFVNSTLKIQCHIVKYFAHWAHSI